MKRENANVVKRVLRRTMILVSLLLSSAVMLAYAQGSVDVLSKVGSRGSEVTMIQQNLRMLGYYTGAVDGVFGQGTQAAVTAYQRSNGLGADGVAGTATISKLKAQIKAIQQGLKGLGYYGGADDGIAGTSTRTAVTKFQGENRLSADGVVGAGTHSRLLSRVRGVQENLKALGHYKGSIDGTFGQGTRSAVINYQAVKGLWQDGVAGVATRERLSADIKEIQTLLQKKGYYTGAIDGAFGQASRNTLIAFQRNSGLVADGIAGAKTLAALRGTGGTGGGTAGGGTEAGGTGGAGNNAGGTLNSSDLALLARLVSAEARGEPYAGQVAVGAVILNRVKHPSFPDTIAGVIYQPGAFTAITDGQVHEPVTETAKRAAKDAMNGWDPSGGAIYYFNPAKTSNAFMWSRPLIVIIGEHRFCS